MITKNKYLRRLVRNYEIELQRPKGLKYLDMLIRNSEGCFYNMSKFSLFVSRSIHKECNL